MKSGSLTHSGMPPEYGTQSYWDHRFANETKPFDWLLPADCLDSTVRSVLSAFSTPCDDSCPECRPRDRPRSQQAQKHLPRVLHVGCGSSQTSFRLRSLVSHPSQITNMDYSPAAIRQCVRREKELFANQDGGAGGAGGGEGMMTMQWEVADLLSAADVSRLGKEGAGEDAVFDVIVDKSTCDAIACTDDVEVAVPYEALRAACGSPSESGLGAGAVAPGKESRSLEGEQQHEKIHPLHLLSLHLASITRRQTGRWVILSYSNDRFPFLEKSRSADAAGVVYQSVLDKGVPDPRRLWRLERKESLKPKTEKLVEETEDGIVYKPEVTYWLYVLARTDVEI